MKNLFAYILLLFSLSTSAQVNINEICSSNQSSLIDEFGDSPDWIELHNAGMQPVNISDWYLSDNENNHYKWQFPFKVLMPGEYFVVLASGEDLEEENIHTNFKLSKSGEVISLSTSDSILVSQIFTPPLLDDISYGRKENGTTENIYFSVPTPNQSNINASQTSRNTVPEFSVTTQKHQESFLLELWSNVPNTNIFYTTDGSLPDENGVLYSEPIFIEENTAIRAQVFSDDLLPSKVVTNTYFFSNPHTIPIMALSTNPENLFNYETGIFELGPNAEPDFPFLGANFWEDTEIPVHIEYFSSDFELLTEFEVGAKTHGGRGARTKPQKAIRLIAEHKYGVNKMNFKFFEDRENNSFERLVLRNGSGDYNYSHCRDEFLGRYLLREKLDLDVLTYQPIVWYINGEYWGVMGLKEKSDQFFLEETYDVNISNLDLLEQDTIISLGSLDIFNTHRAFVVENDLSDNAIFNTAAQYFDTKNIADYFITQTAIVNANWPHNNLKYWREKNENAKWRYLLFDMDIAMQRHPWSAVEIDLFGNLMVQDREVQHTEIFKNLIKNTNFKHYFLNRYADLLNTTFRPEIWGDATRKMQKELEAEMPRHFERWGLCDNCGSFDFWTQETMPKMINFAEKRAPFARQYLQDYFRISNEVLLDFRTYPDGAGTIKVNTIHPEELPWNGYYFNGIPINLTIVPNPGFSFSHWQSLQSISEPNSNQTLTINFQEDDSITAYFTSIYEGLNIQILQNPIQNFTLTIEYTLNENTEVNLTLFATDGKPIFDFPTRIKNGGTHIEQYSLETIPKGLYFLKMSTNHQSQTKKIVIQ